MGGGGTAPAAGPEAAALASAVGAGAEGGRGRATGPAAAALAGNAGGTAAARGRRGAPAAAATPQTAAATPAAGTPPRSRSPALTAFSDLEPEPDAAGPSGPGSDAEQLQAAAAAEQPGRAAAVMRAGRKGVAAQQARPTTRAAAKTQAAGGAVSGGDGAAGEAPTPSLRAHTSSPSAASPSQGTRCASFLREILLHCCAGRANDCRRHPLAMYDRAATSTLSAQPTLAPANPLQAWQCWHQQSSRGVRAHVCPPDPGSGARQGGCREQARRGSQARWGSCGQGRQEGAQAQVSVKCGAGALLGEPHTRGLRGAAHARGAAWAGGRGDWRSRVYDAAWAQMQAYAVPVLEAEPDGTNVPCQCIRRCVSCLYSGVMFVQACGLACLSRCKSKVCG